MKNHYIQIAVLLCCVLLVSCGTKKQVVSSGGGVTAGLAPLENIVETVNANRQAETFATAKMNFSFASGDKSASIGGTLRMKRNDVIQLSLVTFGILEVARIEMTPEYFMGIDKVNKQYIRATYQDVSFFKKAGIDFYTLQALFWDELFLFGGSNSMPTDKQFKKSMEGERAKLTNDESQHAVLTFLVNMLTGLVQQVTVSPHTQGSSPYLTWEYAEFGSLGQKHFPTKHFLTIPNEGKPIKASLSLSNLKNDSDWQARTDTPKRNYKEVTIEQLMSLLMKL